MSRTVDDPEQLRGGVEEVEDLGDEQQQEGLGEMPQDSDDGEDHAREVAVGVAHEDLRGVPVVCPEGEGDADEGEEEEEGEEMRVCGWMWVSREDIQGVIENQEEGDDEGLRDFDAVDAS